MTDMQNLEAQLSEKERQQRVYEAAMASLKQQRIDTERSGYALMAGWTTFGEKVEQGGTTTKIAKGAEMFCIGFAFLTPCLLFAAYVL